MQLEWIVNVTRDEDGIGQQIHYLIDRTSARCLATVADPKAGNILYGTDLRLDMSASDHYYTSLEAAKQYCESMAERADLQGADEASDYLKREFEKLKALVKVEP